MARRKRVTIGKPEKKRKPQSIYLEMIELTNGGFLFYSTSKTRKDATFPKRNKYSDPVKIYHSRTFPVGIDKYTILSPFNDLLTPKFVAALKRFLTGNQPWVDKHLKEESSFSLAPLSAKTKEVA